MATRNDAEVSTLAALRGAADRGWSDLASGQFVDLNDGDLDDFIRELGVRAAQAHSEG